MKPFELPEAFSNDCIAIEVINSFRKQRVKCSHYRHEAVTSSVANPFMDTSIAGDLRISPSKNAKQTSHIVRAHTNNAIQVSTDLHLHVRVENSNCPGSRRAESSGRREKLIELESDRLCSP